MIRATIDAIRPDENRLSAWRYYGRVVWHVPVAQGEPFELVRRGRGSAATPAATIDIAETTRCGGASVTRDWGPWLVGGGLLLIVGGLLAWTGGLSWLGNLPGDIRIDSGHTRIFIPITSMVLVSVALNLLLWFFLAIFRQ